MKPRLARVLLVIAVFALLATVAATARYLSDLWYPHPPGAAPQKPLDLIFWGSFRYYLAWAICAPGVFWLGRKVPIVGRRWYRAVLFHLLVPALAAPAFLAFRILLATVLTATPPPVQYLQAAWRQILAMEVLGTYPIYWLLLAAGVALQVQRDAQARQMQAVQLQRSLSDAQLDTLRMKLQPHFLFNTLNAVASLAADGDTDGVVQVVEHLGVLLRLSMETSARQLVALDEELCLLAAYLAIEEVRHKDRLVVAWQLDPGVGRTLVPSLILQPLVENAISHGLGGRIEAATVEILARVDGDRLELQIRDDGPGLPPGWTLADGAGHGLQNVSERLAVIYGGRAGLDVRPAPGGGTVSSVHLPLEMAPADAGGGRAWIA